MTTHPSRPLAAAAAAPPALLLAACSNADKSPAPAAADAGNSDCVRTGSLAAPAINSPDTGLHTPTRSQP